MIRKKLGHNIRWVVPPLNMDETENLGCSGFPDPMIGKGIVMLGHGGVWDAGALNHSLIVTKHDGGTSNGNAHHPQGVS
jgi:hypothetical protein